MESYKTKQILNFSGLALALLLILTVSCRVQDSENLIENPDQIGSLLGTGLTASNPEDIPLSITGNQSSMTEGTQFLVHINPAAVLNSNKEITVSLDSPALTVNNESSITLTFTPEDANTPQTITIAAPEDDNITNETVTVSISGNQVQSVDFTIEVIDNDTMNISLSGSSQVMEGSTGTLNVRLTQEPSAEVTVTISSSNISTLTASATLTFTPANYATEQTVTMTAVEDADHDSTSIIVSAMASGILTATHNVLTYDNDLTIIFGGATTVNEGETSVATVVLSGNPGATVTVNLTSANDKSLTLAPTTLSFKTSNYRTPQNIILTGENDYNNLDELVVVTASGATFAADATTLVTVTDSLLLNATNIESGRNSTCAILQNNTIKCWGDNGFGGVLGQGDLLDRGGYPGDMGGNLLTVELGSGLTPLSLVSGQSHYCALLADYSVKCWGYNGHGQLGLEDINNRGDESGEMGDNLPTVNLGSGRTARAITAGYYHTCAVLDNYQLKCWGGNQNGQLGLEDVRWRGDEPGEMGDNLPAVNLGAGRTAIAVTASAWHTCAILDNGSVKCWGANTSGELGLGDTTRRGHFANTMGDNLPIVDLGSGRTAKAITAGDAHTCAILDNDTIKCWGNNGFYGQLGVGGSNNRGDEPFEMGNNLPVVNLGSGRTAKAIDAGSWHTCVLLDNDTVKCWGWNLYGNLGLGDTSNRGMNLSMMGDNLPSVELGNDRTALAITAGGGHSCALLDNRTIKCWGYNQMGQLGQEDMNNRADEPGEMGDNLPAINLGSATPP